ncbi:MAG: LLM class flavin-dependent oxidoreductase [Hyphomicrobiaceae bacterium]
MAQRDITFGWFLPTNGDSTCLTDPAQRIPPSRPMLDEIVDAVDNGGYKYLLMPVNAICWEATVVASWYAARTRNVAPLIALRSGYVNPALSARLLATLDQMSGGRLCINLIAGINDDDSAADGILDSKEVRYEKMDEEVTIMKKLWASDEPIGHVGKHYTCNQVIEPKPLQKPHPPFFLGGGSAYAAEISAKHSTVHLFWGDKPKVIEQRIGELRKLAAKYGREKALQFGMRLQIVCADTEAEAWDRAHALVKGAVGVSPYNMRKGADTVAAIRRTSEANRRVWELLEQAGDDLKIHPHLWAGISKARAGAGIAVVGNPEQVAATLQEFVDAGCSSFCLSGFTHAEAARTFSQKVMPYFADRLADGLPQAA